MKRGIVLASVIVCLMVSLFAQLNRGGLTGVVMDSTGAVIPGVKLTIKNTATTATYETSTNDSGQYNMPNLPTGPYEITAEAASFKKLVRSGIELGATAVLRVDLTLEVGAVTESVSVSAEAARLQTETPEVGTSLSSRQLLALPLSFSGARIAENFAYSVSPGVTGNTWASHINGSSEFSKESLLDGATVTTYLSGHFSESAVSVEALQELKIQTTGMSAEFGRSQGGVFNYVMRSGANDIHGSVYGALRNEAFNANSFSNKFRGAKRNLDRKQNYAFSFGGPMYLPKIYNGKNKSFFYTTYERYRERTGGYGAPNRTVPQPEWYDGDFSRLLGPATAFTDAMGRAVYRGAIYDPATFSQMSSGRYMGEMFPGNKIPVSRISQVSQKLNSIAKAHYPPLVRDATGQWALQNNGLYPLSQTPQFDQHQFSQKLDQIISDHHKLSGSYSYIARPRHLLDQGNLWEPGDPEGGPLSKARHQRIKSQLARFAYDANISPRLLNNFTVYWNRMANPNIGGHVAIDGAKDLGIKGLTTYGYPAINWGGGPFVTLHNPGDPQNDFQVYTGWGVTDTVSFSKGRHFMKAGFDARRNHLSTRPTQGGSINFNARATAIPNETYSGTQIGYAFASYLLGIVDSAGLGDPVGLGGRRHYYGTYFQDDFKVNSRLTLNLGLRWEFQPPFTEVGSRISSWNPAKTDPVSGLPGAYDFAGSCNGCTGQSYFGTRSWRDFGPRIGFAWRPIGNWTIRGAYGIYYEGDLFNGFSGTPQGKASSVAWGGTWALSSDPVTPWKGIFNWDDGWPASKYVPPSFDVSWGNSNRPGMVDPSYGKTPYIQQWNLNIQREVIRNLVVEVGYIGNKGTGLHDGALKLLNQLPSSYLTTYGRNLNNAVTSAADAAANGVKYPYPGFRGTVASALRQFPQVQGNQTVNNYGAPLGFSTFHSMQIVVNRQFSKGLTVYTNYVWSKTMQNAFSSMVGSDPQPQDYYNLRLQKAVASYDQPHMFKSYADYELPIGRGKLLAGNANKGTNALVGGWSVSAILNYFSGTPLSFGGSSPLSGGWNGGGNRANIAAGDMKVSNFSKSNFNLANTSAAGNTYLNKSLFSDPAPLTLGTAAPFYTQIRGFGTTNEDIGIQKNNRINEKLRFQFRAELLNVFNRHNLGGINTSVTNPLFGQVTSVSGNRTVQFGMRLDF